MLPGFITLMCFSAGAGAQEGGGAGPTRAQHHAAWGSVPGSRCSGAGHAAGTEACKVGVSNRQSGRRGVCVYRGRLYPPWLVMLSG